MNANDEGISGQRKKKNPGTSGRGAPDGSQGQVFSEMLRRKLALGFFLDTVNREGSVVTPRVKLTAELLTQNKIGGEWLRRDYGNGKMMD